MEVSISSHVITQARPGWLGWTRSLKLVVIKVSVCKTPYFTVG